MPILTAGRILSITCDCHGGVTRGRVDFNGIRTDVVLAQTPEACVGDYVLAPFGVAMAAVDEREAQRAFDISWDPGSVDDEFPGQE